MNLGKITPEEWTLWQIIYLKAIEIKACELFAHGTKIYGTSSLEVANWAVTIAVEPLSQFIAGAAMANLKRALDAYRATREGK